MIIEDCRCKLASGESGPVELLLFMKAMVNPTLSLPRSNQHGGHMGNSLVSFCLLISLPFIFLPLLAIAGPDEDKQMGRPVFENNGQIFTIQFSPGSSRVEINLVGDPIAKFDPEEFSLFGQAFSSSGRKSDLKLVWHDNHYQVQDPINPTDHVDIEVRHLKTSKTKTFHFDGKSVKSETPPFNPHAKSNSK
jgi:hypothetical protein